MDSDIVLLENLRFYQGEVKNEKKFGKLLAKMAHIYVNDAFAASHRAHASVSAIKKYLPSYAGLLLAEEIENLNKILKPVKPMVAVIGGNKADTKMKLVDSLRKKSFMVLIGGALANNFIAAHKFEVGKSVISQEYVKLAEKFANKNIILPVDVLVGSGKNVSEARVKPISQVEKNDMILDIGPRTIKLFADYIKKANTIIWNGPMGYSENACFKHGTMAIAQIFASRSRGPAFGVVGGGETVAALKQSKMTEGVDWVSTGGGAMLSYLAGEKMPGLKGIIK
jgi:phosphoglycerate kinase